MKTGKVAKLFKADPKTITGWTDTFNSFFSHDSQLIDGNKLRNYNPDDLIILNTIQSLRNRGIGTEDIRDQLRNGFRDENLPATAVEMGTEQAIATYAQLKQYKLELQMTQDLLSRERERNEQLQLEVRRLEREIGRLQGKYEQNDDK